MKTKLTPVHETALTLLRGLAMVALAMSMPPLHGPYFSQEAVGRNLIGLAGVIGLWWTCWWLGVAAGAAAYRQRARDLQACLKETVAIVEELAPGRDLPWTKALAERELP